MVTLTLCQNDQSSFLVDHDLGGKIMNLTLVNKFGTQVPVIDGHYTSPSLFCQDGCFIMYPWVNRLNSDTFNYNNQNYKVQPIIRDENKLPLHGLYPMNSRTIIEEGPDYIKMQPTDLDPRFAAFTETYRLINQSTFEIIVNAFNNSIDHSNQPVGFGFHPYLQLLDKNINDLQLITNLDSYIKVDNKLLPIGDILQTGNINDILPQNSIIGSRILDNGFTKSTLDQDGIFVQLLDPVQNYGLQIKFYSNQYSTPMNFWQIFTPPDRSRIAIEPQTCSTDAFRVQNSGMINLKPGESIQTGFRIEMI